MAEATDIWLETLARKRLAQASNVYLVETFDEKRRSALNTKPTTFFTSLFRPSEDYKHVMVLDVQRGTVSEIVLEARKDPNTHLPIANNEGKNILEPIREPVRIEGSPVKYLDGVMQQESTVLIIDYVFTQGHVENLANALAAWADDDAMYALKSTVIVFTSSSSLFPNALRKMLYTIDINPSTPEERREVLRLTAEQLQEIYGNNTELVKITDDLISASSGLNLHQVETAACESFYLHRKFTVESFTTEKIKILADFGIRYVEPTRGFESVGGYDELKNYIASRIIFPLRNPDVARRYGQEIPRGIMLYGVPGCGKTYLARALSKQLALPMLELSASDIMSSLYGETESRVRQITQLIDSISPCAVFVDEYDGLMPSRETLMSADSGTTQRMLTSLLSWLGSEHRESFVITTTNFIEKIDKAAKRADRVGKIILVITPDMKARKEILDIHLLPIVDYHGKDRLGVNVDLPEIVRKTFLYTGDDLKQLVKEATALAMDDRAKAVATDHFLQALEYIRVNKDERRKTVEQMIETAKKEESIDLRFIGKVEETFRREMELMAHPPEMTARKSRAAGVVVK